MEHIKCRGTFFLYFGNVFRTCLQYLYDLLYSYLKTYVCCCWAVFARWCAFFVMRPSCAKGLRIIRHHFQNWRINVCMRGGVSLLVFLNRPTFFFIRCNSPLWAVLINKVAFSLAADDFMSEEKGEAVSNLGRNCHHQFQLGKKNKADLN